MNVGNICWRWLLVRAMPSGGLATTTTWPTIAIMRNLPIKFRQSTRLPGGLASRWKGGTLPLLKQALKDTAPRKLIVLHLFGIHSHYQLPHPPDRAPFRNIKDGVYHDMR